MTAPMLVIGIDPGVATSALAALGGSSVISLVDLPVHMIPARGRGLRAELDGPALHIMLAELGPVAHVFIESIGPMPKQGIASTWRFAEAYGTIKAIVMTMGFPVTLVSPKTWQRFHGIGRTGDEARRRAGQLYPDATSALARKRDSHRADAVLLAAYGMHKLANSV
jgi:crossover junction endodeoxyribonuclease RuvC